MIRSIPAIILNIIENFWILFSDFSKNLHAINRGIKTGIALPSPKIAP